MPIPVPISAHNAPLPPDALTTVQFNFEWRRLVVELLWPMQSEDFWAGSQADIESAVDKASAMIEDIYTTETVGGTMAFSGARKSLDNDVVLFANNDFPVPMLDPALDVWSFDTDGFHNVAIPAHFDIPVGLDGLYRVHGQARFKFGTDALMRAMLVVNGGEARAQSEVRATSNVTLGAACILPLLVGDNVRLEVFATQARTVLAGVENQYTFLDIQRIGDIP